MPTEEIKILEVPLYLALTAYKRFEDWVGDEVTFEFELHEIAPITDKEKEVVFDKETGDLIHKDSGLPLKVDSDAERAFIAKNKDGRITFPYISITTTGEYHFLMTESSPSKENWHHNDAIYHIVVTVDADELGEASVSIIADTDDLIFTNRYESKDNATSVTLHANIQTIGDYLKDNTFAFVITAHEEKTVKPTVILLKNTTDTTGILTVHLPTFTRSGIYRYHLSQLTNLTDWHIDQRTYPIDITVTRNPDGTLASSTEYPKGIPSFLNICAKEKWPIPKTVKQYSSLGVELF